MDNWIIEESIIVEYEYDEEQATDLPAAPFRHFGPQDPQGQAVQKVRYFEDI